MEPTIGYKEKSLRPCQGTPGQRISGIPANGTSICSHRMYLGWVIESGLYSDYFTLFYYTTGLYKQDYEEMLGADLPTNYHVNDTWSNYDSLKARINERYGEWTKLKALLGDATTN